MPAPVSYSESALLGFMEDELGSTGESLGLLTTDALQRAVWAVQRLLELDDIADATDMALVEAAARWEAWKAAKKAAVNQFDLKAGTSDLKRSQTFDHITAMLAETEAAWYTALAVSEGGSGVTGFVFATIGGCRGR